MSNPNPCPQCNGRQGSHADDCPNKVKPFR